MDAASIPREAITGIVLAGGRGTRMGDIDKGLQLFRGQPLFLHATARLLPQVSALLVNANRNPESYARAGFPVIADEYAAFGGPLAGFATGLKHCHTPWLVTVPCDSPFFPETLVTELGKAVLAADADLAIAVTGQTPPFAPQPVFCLMKRDLLPHLEAFLQTGQRKIDAWYATLKVAQAHFADEAAFGNINTHEALQQLENLPENKL
ncbi:molybdenum cofactor guanylyltransferase MobA [Oxalobacter sp. OttesenSCG-928-P03]|nr:molybdenum cofactor guanylyltransferase MobA [Oxalobacter sp. OttesenSCG-928-P03]